MLLLSCCHPHAFRDPTARQTCCNFFAIPKELSVCGLYNFSLANEIFLGSRHLHTIIDNVLKYKPRCSLFHHAHTEIDFHQGFRDRVGRSTRPTRSLNRGVKPDHGQIRQSDLFVAIGRSVQSRHLFARTHKVVVAVVVAVIAIAATVAIELPYRGKSSKLAVNVFVIILWAPLAAIGGRDCPRH